MERWAREAVEAEAYSRRLAKRIREGYAAKRRRLGVPGGNRAPLGTVRQGRTMAVDEASLAIVHRAYELASAGLSDRQVGAATDLALKHVAEVLTNPFYIGRLRTGEPSALGPIVDVVIWEQVQALRARYSRRHRGAVSRRTYGLAGILACANCGRRLIGHSGRYRHVDACDPFKAAAPRRRRRFDTTNLDHRVKGESYKVDLYEQAVGRAFEHVVASARLKVDTVTGATRPDPEAGDVLALARIDRSATRRRCGSRATATWVDWRPRWRASTSRRQLPWRARRGRQPLLSRSPTLRICRGYGQKPPTPDATRSPRRPSRGSTSWG